MADCGSHQRNPQIPSKMEKFKTKMLGHLKSQGKCLKETDEFTKPKNGQIVAKFDPYLNINFKVNFDLMIKSAEENFSNILFATSASPETLANAEYNDLLKIQGDVPIGSPYPEIDRHPAIWVMPGNKSDEKVGLMMCGEYVQWGWNPNEILGHWEKDPNGVQTHSELNPKSLTRCWNHENVEAWKQLTIGKWLASIPNRYRSTKRIFLGTTSNSINTNTFTTMKPKMAPNMTGLIMLQLVTLQKSPSVVMM